MAFASLGPSTAHLLPYIRDSDKYRSRSASRAPAVNRREERPRSHTCSSGTPGCARRSKRLIERTSLPGRPEPAGGPRGRERRQASAAALPARGAANGGCARGAANGSPGRPASASAANGGLARSAANRGTAVRFLIHLLIFIYIFIYLCIDIYLFIYLFTHSFIHSFIRSFVRSFVHLFITNISTNSGRRNIE